MKIQESAENYLETILILQTKLPEVRSIDIVNELDFTKPSVSIAMKKLRDNGYITVNAAGYIALTDTGRAIAASMLERHRLLSACLMKLGVEEHIATQDACRIEHVISQQSFDAIKSYLQKLEK